jgi:hypothetical protein
MFNLDSGIAEHRRKVRKAPATKAVKPLELAAALNLELFLERFEPFGCSQDKLRGAIEPFDRLRADFEQFEPSKAVKLLELSAANLTLNF